MKRLGKAIRALSMTLLALSIMCTPFLDSVKAQSPPVMYADPPVTVTQMNATFSVYVSVDNVTDLCSWQVYIYYLNQVIEAVGYSEGPFLKAHGPTMFDGNFDNNYNATHGQLWMYCLRTWSGTGVDGGGILATANFTAKAGASTPLAFTNDILGNSTAQRIDHLTQGGFVEVGGHDVAVISVIPLKTIIGQGYRARVNVTVENQGSSEETFNLTLNHVRNSTVTQIGVLTVTPPLPINQTRVLTFSWNVSGVSTGNYSLNAVAETVPYETDTADNNFTDGSVHVGVPGDVSSSTQGVYDGIVNMRDIQYMILLFNAKPDSTKWNPNADVNDDDVINMRDINIAILNFNKRE